jgi:hypothetical protein
MESRMRGNLHVRFGGRIFVACSSFVPKYKKKTKNETRCGYSTLPYEYSDFLTDSGESIDFDSYMLPVDRSGKSISWAQRSNSGDTLKIIVPSHNGNVMSGQNNYLGTVTSYDRNESEMGYRGSKSCAIAQVKEQRVDGRYSFQVELLRYTLMAPVRGYQTEILSNKNNVSENVVVTKRPKLNKLDPWIMTGFVDLLLLRKSKRLKVILVLNYLKILKLNFSILLLCICEMTCCLGCLNGSPRTSKGSK